jgi:hypothetical protein
LTPTAEVEDENEDEEDVRKDRESSVGLAVPSFASPKSVT